MSEEAMANHGEFFLFDPKTPTYLCIITCFLALICMWLFTFAMDIVRRCLYVKIEACDPRRKVGEIVTIAYKTGTGPYKNCGKLFQETFGLFPSKQTIGIYYDDPDSTAEEDLRYAVGSIIFEGNESDFEQEDEGYNEEIELALTNHFKIYRLSRPNDAVTAEFPFFSILCCILTPFLVYPKMKKFIRERSLCAYPAIEIYRQEHIQFIMPLSRQEEFFVPEFCEDEISIATTTCSHTNSTNNDPAQVDQKPSNSNLASECQEQAGESKQDHVFAKPMPPYQGGEGDSSIALKPMQKEGFDTSLAKKSTVDTLSEDEEFEDLAKEATELMESCQNPVEETSTSA